MLYILVLKTRLKPTKRVEFSTLTGTTAEMMKNIFKTHESNRGSFETKEKRPKVNKNT